MLNFLSYVIKSVNSDGKITIRCVMLEIQEVDDSSDNSGKDQQKMHELTNGQQMQTSYIKFAIEIEDSSDGIDQEQLQKMFVDLSKVEELKFVDKSTNFGLSISKLIVDKMRGDVNMQSSVGKGTLFSIIVRSKALIQKQANFFNRILLKKKHLSQSLRSPIDDPQSL